MKITIIGSTQYKQKFIDLKEKLESRGHEVCIPAFDDHPEFDDLQVCLFNRKKIEWADQIYLIWDRRSVGTIFDFGMVFMARKPLVIEYLEPKTFENVMKKYEAFTSKEIEELKHLIKRFSMESDSNTSDFILADYLINCLKAFNQASEEKKKHDINI